MVGRLAALRYRVQLTTDGHKPYLSAVEDSLADHVWSIEEIVALMGSGR